jgi:hypothetical protein
MMLSTKAPASPAAMVLSEAGSGGGAAFLSVAALWRLGRSCGGVLLVFGSPARAVNYFEVISTALKPRAFSLRLMEES